MRVPYRDRRVPKRGQHRLSDASQSINSGLGRKRRRPEAAPPSNAADAERAKFPPAAARFRNAAAAAPASRPGAFETEERAAGACQPAVDISAAAATAAAAATTMLHVAVDAFLPTTGVLGVLPVRALNEVDTFGTHVPQPQHRRKAPSPPPPAATTTPATATPAATAAAIPTHGLSFASQRRVLLDAVVVVVGVGAA